MRAGEEAAGPPMRSCRRCLPKERGLQSAGSRHSVRAAKEVDSKSIGLCPQGFESPRCRLQGWREVTEKIVGG